MTSRLRGCLGTALLLAFSIALALGVGEVAARLLYPRARAVSWYRYDPRYGFRHRADRDVLSSEWGDGAAWRVRTNAHGFRGADWSFEQPAGKRRVLFAGDSFTFGNGVDDAHTFPAAVARTLESSEWDVINLGTSGWGPQNALAWLRTEGAALEASCLVYVFYEGNDAMDGIAHGIFELSGDTLARRAQPEPTRSQRFSMHARQFPAYVWLLEHSQLLNVARNAMRNRLAARGTLSPDQQLYSSPNATQISDALRLNRVTLDALRALALERYGAFGLVLVPMPEQVFGPTPEREPLSSPVLARHTHYDVVTWAMPNRVPVVDLLEAWRADPEAARTYYFERDFHLTPAGNEAVGREVAQRLPSLCAPPAPLTPAPIS